MKQPDRLKSFQLLIILVAMKSRDIHDNSILTDRIGRCVMTLAFPIMVSSLLQMLYNTVDAVVVGQLLGANALAAVGGTTSTAVGTIVNFFTGLASGATVLVSQYFGAGDEKNVSKSVHNAVAMAIVSTIVVSVGGYFFSRPLLVLIDTPPEIMDMACQYMEIYFIGSATIIVYSIVAGIYRALGENRKILFYIAAGCVVNIVLDILFVGPFAMGVKGAALATVLSQGASMVLSVVGVFRRSDCCKVKPGLIRFDKVIMKKTLAIGIPSALQSIVYSYTNLLVGAFVNRLGAQTAAAWAAYGKLDMLFWLICSAYAIGLETFVGQNFGARQTDRCRKSLRISMLNLMLITMVFEALMMIFGRQGLRLFVSDSQVIETGMKIIFSIVPLYFAFVPVQIYCSTIKGCGKTAIPSLVNVVGVCVIRVLWLNIVPPFFGNSIPSIMLAYGVSWAITSVILGIYYHCADIYDERYTVKT